MKKTFFGLFAALAATMLLTACDPACTEECVVKNQSGHDVVMTRYYTIHSGGWNDWQPIEDSLRTRVETLKAGEEKDTVYVDLGITGRSRIEHTMSYRYWLDSVAFTFDDGTTRVFHPDCDTVWGPYAFDCDSYTYEEESNRRLTFHGEILWARLTYTLTEEDYNRAKGD